MLAALHNAQSDRLRDETDLLHFVKSSCRYLNNAHRVAIFILRNKVEAVSVRAVNELFT